MYLAAVNRGDLLALKQMIRLFEQVGDVDGAERARRFGLADDGTAAPGDHE